MKHKKYDYRVSKQLTYKDENAKVWKYEWDGFGRLMAEINPGDSESFPTRVYDYGDYEFASLGRPIVVIKQERETSGEDRVYRTYQYFDGFLRDLQTRRPWQVALRTRSFLRRKGALRRLGLDDARIYELISENIHYQVRSRAYNVRGQQSEETLFYLEPGEQYSEVNPTRPRHRFAYDALLRRTRETNPDGTFKVVTRTPWLERVSDEEDTDPASSHHDTPSQFQYNSEELIVRVDRRLGSRELTYELDYDLLGNLVEAHDPASNSILWVLDTRGLLLRMDHPDAGTIYHYYDASGKEVARVYSNGDTIEFEYDDLGRINKRELHGAFPEVTSFSYDSGEGSNLVGRLSTVSDDAGQVVFSYDERGRETLHKRILTDQQSQPLMTRFTYDSMDRLRSVEYPDNRVVNYRYGMNGKVEQVDGLVRILYHQSGNPAEFTFNGGIRHTIYRNPNTHRVSRRVVTKGVTKFCDYTYKFDNIGNATKVVDNCRAAGHISMGREYTYDDLYRLASFRSERGDSESYEYDDVGNITKHTGYSNNALVYPSSGQTSTLRGAQGSDQWEYDVNGKMIKGADFANLEWDAAQNLVLAIELNGTRNEFIHAFDGEVIRRTRVQPDGTTETVTIPNQFYSEYPHHSLRRVYVDNTMVAIEKRDSSGESSILTITDETGNVIGTVSHCYWLSSTLEKDLRDSNESTTGLTSKC